MSSIPEKPRKPHPDSASSTHSPTPSSPAASCPHNTVRRNGKARALRNTTSASAHSHNSVDTTEHRAHNRTPDPTPRRDKLTRQEVPGKHPRPASPTTSPATTQTHDITTATIAPGETSSSALLLLLSQSKCR
ncbi:hypothetical protein CHARACLAT_033646 [Characodon lateralis]|uniref:Uncharacterized protein n=1 Tax=Characodon lateralis TaxID=208331 RepID=A0ABU7CTF4_9TELE|nr:hypothetical protein [Characodon lateralis]